MHDVIQFLVKCTRTDPLYHMLQMDFDAIAIPKFQNDWLSMATYLANVVGMAHDIDFNTHM